jgi:hypothetical protein
MPLLKRNVFINDEWVHLDDAALLSIDSRRNGIRSRVSPDSSVFASSTRKKPKTSHPTLLNLP